MRVILDTNTLISAIIFKGGNEDKILHAAHNGNFKLIISLEIFKELKKVLSRPKFWLSQKQIGDALMHIIEIAEIVEPNIKLDIIKEDPDDNKILECAVFAKADYIVSGDKHLLKLKNVNGIPIVTSSELIEKLKTYL